ncbi:MAG: SpoIIE family protein phosphatase [bacterium]|nr:SpoIIE family protein phosphatase [bacterium]
MTGIENLLILYAGIVLINTIVSALLWRKQRDKLSKQLFSIWLATFIVYILQGTLLQNNLLIVIGFSFTLLINIAISDFLKTIADRPIKHGLYYGVMILAVAISGGLFLTNQPFTRIALPVTIAVAFPLIHTAFILIKNDWKKLGFSPKALTITCVFFAIHNIDFAFLRMVDEAAPMGFTVATLLISALSLFAPAIVIERVTATQARISAEMDVAKRIQTDMLPKSPKIPGYQLSCYMNPAEEVGGDYYDIIPGEDRSWILMGDVTGHGLGSGLVMFMVQSIMSSILSTRPDLAPKELNFIANKILYNNLQRLNDQRPTTIATLSMTNTGNIAISGCHDNIYVYREDTATIETICLDHFPMGLGFTDQFSEDMFEQTTIDLKKNDVLLLCTDGITEAQASKITPMYSENRLIELFQKHAVKPIEEIKTLLIEDLDRFTKGNYDDDITFILVKYASTTEVVVNN